MRKIALFSILFVLCLTGCQEKKQQPPIVENSDMDEADDKDNSSNDELEDDKTDDSSHDNSQDGNQEEDNGDDSSNDIMEIVYLEPLATHQEGTPLYIENGEVKVDEREANTFSSTFVYDGREIKVVFTWEMVGGAFFGNMTEPHNSYFPGTEVYENKVLWCYAADASTGKFAYYQCDLEKQTVEPTIHSDELAGLNIADIVILPDTQNAIAVGYGDVYYYDGESLTKLNLPMDGENIFDIKPMLVNSQVWLICSGAKDGRNYMASCLFEEETKTLEMQFEMEYSKLESFFWNKNGYFAIRQQNGYLMFTNLLDGRNSVTDIFSSEVAKRTIINETYCLVAKTDGILLVVNMSNGRIIGKTPLPVQLDARSYFNVLPSEESLYVCVYLNDGSKMKAVYKIELE